MGFRTGTLLTVRAGHCPGYVFTSDCAVQRCRQTSHPWAIRLATSSRSELLVQSSWLAEVPHLLVLRSHFAVGHFLGCVVFLRRAAPTTLSDRCPLSSSFAFLQSIAQHNLVCRPQSANSSHGLLLPSAHQGSAVHLSRDMPEPATFRLQGLVTLLAVYSRRARAGFLSHRRRSWDSPFGAFSSRKVSVAFAIG
jgi:hypothetical protein